jgi:hypothetical protein
MRRERKTQERDTFGDILPLRKPDASVVLGNGGITRIVPAATVEKIASVGEFDQNNYFSGSRG